MTAPTIIRTTSEHVASLREGARRVPCPATVIRVEGPGAIDCLQGLLTCDVVAPGDGAVFYGAMLTTRGMIVADFTVLRDGPNAVTLVAAPEVRSTILGLLTRQVPPRLARVTDQTETVAVLWLAGLAVADALRRTRMDWPGESGRLVNQRSDADRVVVARPAEQFPWSALLLGTPGAVESAARRLQEAGVTEGTVEDLETLRILSAWPALGREIDDKTLPQEVRLDELGGVSYTKGCYLGQETVARVHFRGHVNRVLRGLVWRGAELPATDVRQGGKVVGRVTSGLTTGDAGVALGILRREVEPGATVQVGSVDTLVVSLPFQPGNSEAPGVLPGASPGQ
jgi:folate-binding protein YgfZ